MQSCDCRTEPWGKQKEEAAERQRPSEEDASGSDREQGSKKLLSTAGRGRA